MEKWKGYWQTGQLSSTLKNHWLAAPTYYHRYQEPVEEGRQTELCLSDRVDPKLERVQIQVHPYE